MNIPQILYLTGALALLALFATRIALARPKGPQPATYGHLQTLVDLVDEWPFFDGKLYWGHKGVGRDGIGHAGTASIGLKAVKHSISYMG
jgi:hypothetical protein